MSLKMVLVIFGILILFSILAVVDFYSRSKPARDKNGQTIKNENGGDVISFNNKDPRNPHAYISRLILGVGFFVFGFIIIFCNSSRI